MCCVGMGVLQPLRERDITGAEPTQEILVGALHLFTPTNLAPILITYIGILNI